MAAERKMAADTNGELRELIDEWAIAVRAKDIESVMSQYLSDVVAFDVVDPLEYKGTDMLRQRLTDWFSSFEGPFGFEITNLEVEAGDYLAFCHSLNRAIGIKTDGVQVNCIHPSYVDTERFARRVKADMERTGKSEAEVREWHRADIGTIRLGTTDDVANLVAFIVSPRGRWLHGATVDLDGGEVKAF